MALPQIGLPSALRIYLALEPVDMRKQYDGLWALASQHLGEKIRDRLKLFDACYLASVVECNGYPVCESEVREMARLVKGVIDAICPK